jgi:hypothetical protein
MQLFIEIEADLSIMNLRGVAMKKDHAGNSDAIDTDQEAENGLVDVEKKMSITNHPPAMMAASETIDDHFGNRNANVAAQSIDAVQFLERAPTEVQMEANIVKFAARTPKLKIDG